MVTQEAGGFVPAGEASPPHLQDRDKPGLAGDGKSGSLINCQLGHRQVALEVEWTLELS